LPKATATGPVVGRIVNSGREQQAFAKFDPNFVIDRYLPEKLKHPEKFLP
jgi:DNA topoisomerase VI subunit A